MELAPYLHFSGNCEEAIAFYAKILNGKIIYRGTYGESPMAKMVPAEYGGKIMHATIELDGRHLYCCDAPPDRQGKMQGITISIETKNVTESEKIFNALSEGGNIEMPFQKTFWSAGFGMFQDKFGVPWMINTHEAQA